MKDPRYKFTVTVSVHLLILNKNNEVLMTKRPNTWEWGPGRWGTVGGKIYEHENFFDAIKRKSLQEMGFEVNLRGLYQIKQLIIKDKQSLMFFFVGKYKEEKFTGEMEEYKWFGRDDVKTASAKIFTEYFYKNMLKDLLAKPLELLPISMIESLNYIKLSDEKNYKDWFEGMIKTDYDPKVIPDFQKWERSKK